MGFGTPLSLVIGLILIAGGLVLLFLGNFRPDIKRDSDNVYAILAIIAGILGVISFNKDIVPSLEQLLLAGMAIFLMWENVNSRSANGTSQNRSFPDKRREDEFAPPPRRPYRADRAPEYDEFGGAPAGRNAGLSGGGYDYGGRSGYDDRRLPRRDDRERDRSRRDRPNRSSRFDDNYGGSQRDDGFGEPPQITDRSSRPRRDESGYDRGPQMDDDRPRRRRNPEDAPRRRPRPDRVEDVNAETTEDIPSADYVDFTPIESTESGSAANGWGPQG